MKNYDEGKEEGGYGTSDVTLPGLFGREGDELVSSKEVADEVGEDIIGDDEKGRNDKPNEAFIKVVYHEPSLHGDE